MYSFNSEWFYVIIHCVANIKIDRFCLTICFSFVVVCECECVCIAEWRLMRLFTASFLQPYHLSQPQIHCIRIIYVTGIANLLCQLDTFMMMIRTKIEQYTSLPSLNSWIISKSITQIRFDSIQFNALRMKTNAKKNDFSSDARLIK